MGIRDTINKIGRRGKMRDKCEKNKETGEVMCKRVRINPDGSQEDVAGFIMEADADCNPSSMSSYENEDGQLDHLEKKFLPKIIGKCRNKPENY